MLKVFVLLPIFALCFAWFFGARPAIFRGALVTAAIWSIVAYLLMTWDFNDGPFIILVAVALTLLGVPIGALAALLLGGTCQGPSPAERTYEAYEKLTPEDKEKVHKAARVAGKFACKHASKYFRKEGNKFCADAIGTVGKML